MTMAMAMATTCVGTNKIHKLVRHYIPDCKIGREVGVKVREEIRMSVMLNSHQSSDPDPNPKSKAYCFILTLSLSQILDTTTLNLTLT